MSVSPENDSVSECAFARLAARKCACAEFHQVQSKKKNISSLSSIYTNLLGSILLGLFLINCVAWSRVTVKLR